MRVQIKNYLFSALNKQITFTDYVTIDIDSVLTIIHVSGNIQNHLNIPFEVPEKTDIEMRVTTPAAAGVTSIGATFELWYENI